MFEHPYEEISFFNKDGFAVAKNRYYIDPQNSKEEKTEYLIVNTEGKVVKTLTDEADYQEHKKEFTEWSAQALSVNGNGIKLARVEDQKNDGTTVWQKQIIDPTNTVVAVLCETKEDTGVVYFLTDDLILCGYGAGHNGYGDYFMLYNTQGHLVNQTKFDRVGTFENGLSPFILNGKLGLLDETGTIVIEATIPTSVSPNYVPFGLSGNHILVQEEDHRIGIIKITRS